MMAGSAKRIVLLGVLLIGFGCLFTPVDLNVIDSYCHAYFQNKSEKPAGREPATISVNELPPEARTTLKLIKVGGAFPYKKDGTTFYNRERRLPARERGYYKEYTVRTPGTRHRGARRIVAGSRGEFYYTGDHYRTFKLIKE